MNAPRADRVAAIATELGLLGRRLDALAAELSAWRPPGASGPGGAGTDVPQPTPTAAAPPQPAWYGTVPSTPWSGGPRAPWPAGPGAASPTAPAGPVAPPVAGGGPWPAAPQPFPPAPLPPRAPRRSVRAWLASLSGARLLAWTGAAVTLLGVVLLLALAAARGWFAPPVRVVAGAVLGLGLVGLGVRLHRRPSSRTGALAVTGTGIATLYLVVAAATALYGYLPVPVGLLLALLVAAGGLALADRWRAVLLGCGAVVGAALLAPVVTARLSPLLVALVLVLQVAATAVALRRRWPALAGIAAGWPVLYGTLVAGIAAPTDRWGSAAASAAVLVVGVAAAAWTVRPEPLPRGLRIALAVVAPLPALTYAATVGEVPGAVLAFAAAVLLFAVAALPGRDHVLRVVALVAGAVALFEATAVAFDGNAETAALLGQGVVLLIVAAALRSRPALVVGGVVGAAGVLAATAVQVPLEALASYPSAPFVLGITVQRPALAAAVVMSVLVLAAAVAALVGSARVGVLGADARAARLWAPVGLVGLYGAAGLVIALALLMSPSRAGFVTGHAVVTVSWVIVALVLLARGVTRPTLRVAGLVLVGAAVAKLLLFDLVALDGLARVAAFLGAGLLLLAAGTRYARLVAEAEPSAGPEATAGVGSDPALTPGPDATPNPRP
jgi:uncharacterized membrane protein